MVPSFRLPLWQMDLSFRTKSIRQWKPDLYWFIARYHISKRNQENFENFEK